MTENSSYKYSDLTKKIIGAAIEVHKIFGNGFQEVIYQRCLAIELSERKIIFEREKEMLLDYKGINVGTRRVDFLVENKIMLELKAVEKIEDVHLAQTINYLEAYNLEIGLLINFGSKSLEFRRVVNGKLLDKNKKSQSVN
ncbi:MAG: GxxExxY protein [Candidatus Nomurabacteria bacterium]